MRLGWSVYERQKQSSTHEMSLTRGEQGQAWLWSHERFKKPVLLPCRFFPFARIPKR